MMICEHFIVNSIVKFFILNCLPQIVTKRLQSTRNSITDVLVKSNQIKSNQGCTPTKMPSMLNFFPPIASECLKSANKVLKRPKLRNVSTHSI